MDKEKAKEIIELWEKLSRKAPILETYTIDKWLATPEAAALLSGLEGDWVSVESGELPEKINKYLVAGKTRSKPSVWFAQFHGHKFQSFKHRTITHWRKNFHLPEPPKP